MAKIKLPQSLQPIKALLNEGVRKTAAFLATVLTKVSTGPDIFYKRQGPRNPWDQGPPGGGMHGF